jgi:hypothetical protein
MKTQFLLIFLSASVHIVGQNKPLIDSSTKNDWPQLSSSEGYIALSANGPLCRIHYIQ